VLDAAARVVPFQLGVHLDPVGNLLEAPHADHGRPADQVQYVVVNPGAHGSSVTSTPQVMPSPAPAPSRCPLRRPGPPAPPVAASTASARGRRARPPGRARPGRPGAPPAPRRR